MGNFDECLVCKPPKRYPGCQDHCPEYKKGKAKHDKEKAAERLQKSIGAGIYNQKDHAVNKALKKIRRRGGG